MGDLNNFVRIIVLNYNQPKYTISTVNALLLQSVENKEIIVVDNFSTIINFDELKKGLPKEVILLRTNANLGYSKGNNIGCQYITKHIIDYYFIVNNDVIIEDNNLIASLIVSIKNNQSNNVVAASPMVDTLSTELPLIEQIQIRKILHFYEQIIVISPILNKVFFPVLRKYTYKDKMPYLNKYTFSDTINGAAFLIKGDVFENNEFLDAGTFLFHEELILGMQLKNKGYTCVLDGFTSLKHLQGLSTNSYKKAYNIIMEKEKVVSEIYYFQKYFKIKKIYTTIIKGFRYVEVYLLYLYSCVFKK